MSITFRNNPKRPVQDSGTLPNLPDLPLQRILSFLPFNAVGHMGYTCTQLYKQRDALLIKIANKAGQLDSEHDHRAYAEFIVKYVQNRYPWVEEETFFLLVLLSTLRKSYFTEYANLWKLFIGTAQEDNYWTSALHISAKRDDEFHAKFFLHKWKWSPNLTDSQGDTPLHFAAHFNSYKVASLLLENGVDRYALDHNNQNPAAVAAACGNLRMRITLLPTKEFAIITGIAMTAFCLLLASLFMPTNSAFYSLLGGGGALLLVDAIATPIILRRETRRTH